DPHVERFADFVLETVEVLRLAGALPRRVEDLPRVVEHNPLANIGTGACSVHATWIGRQQYIVGGAERLQAVELARWGKPFEGGQGVACDTAAGRSVADVERLEARVDRGVFEFIRRTHRLITGVLQMPPV